MSLLQERLEVELQCGAREEDVKVLEHLGVEHAEGADLGVAALLERLAELREGVERARSVGVLERAAQEDGRGAAREEGGIVGLLEVVADLGGGIVAVDARDGQGEHELVEQPVHHLEAGRLVAVDGADVALVARHALLLGGVLERDVGHLEDLHGQRVLLVLTQRLEKPRDERGAHHLELGGLGVAEHDRLGLVVLAVHEAEVFVVRAEDQRERLDPARVRTLLADDVAERVDGERRTDRVGRGEGLGQVVEAVRHCDVLHQVALVQDVGPRHRHVDHHLVVAARRRGVAHARKEARDLLGVVLQARAPVHVRGVRERAARVQVRRDLLVSVGVYDTDRLDRKRLGAVLGEHGDEDVEHDVELRLVDRGHVDKHVARVQRDLGVVRVDDRRHGQHAALVVKDDRVHGAVADDVQVAAEVQVGLVERHELRAAVLLGAVQRREAEGVRWQRLVGERRLDRVEVVRADGHERAAAREVLVQLVLQINEARVALRGEAHVAQHRAGKVRPDLRGLWRDGQSEQLLGLRQAVLGRFVLPEEDAQRAQDALEAQQVVSVRRDIDFELRALVGALDLLGGVVIELDAELEAELIKLLGGVLAPEALEQQRLVHADGRHGAAEQAKDAAKDAHVAPAESPRGPREAP